MVQPKIKCENCLKQPIGCKANPCKKQVLGIKCTKFFRKHLKTSDLFIHTGSGVIFLFLPSTLSSLHLTNTHNLVFLFDLVLCALCPYHITVAGVPLKCSSFCHPQAGRIIKHFCYQNGSSWWSSLLTITVLAGCPVLSCSVQDFFKLPWKLALMLYCNIEGRQLDCLLFHIYFSFISLSMCMSLFSVFSFFLLPVEQITCTSWSGQDVLYYQIMIFNMSLPS